MPLVPEVALHPDSNLISLGFDSLRMMRAAGIWRKTGHDVSFADLLAHPTPRDWARIISAGAPSGSNGAPDSEPSAKPMNPAGDEFRLAPLQYAYWAGSMEETMGGVTAHLYVELDGPEQEPTLLEQATQELFDRHPMLRTRILQNGMQRIEPRPAEPVLTVHDLRKTDTATREEWLDETRRRMSASSSTGDRGRLLEIRMSRLPGGRARYHVDFDMLAGDAMSYRIVLDDLASLVEGIDLPPITTSFRDYLEHPSIRKPTHRESHRSWWQKRIADLPQPPELPTTDTPGDGARRLNHTLDPEQRRILEKHSRANGVTPAAALATAFAAAIGGFTESESFLLNLPLFHREPVHDDIDLVVGDFSSSILVPISSAPDHSAISRIRRLAEAISDSAGHADYSALDVLRDLSRHEGHPVFAPVVYTSAVGLGELFSSRVRRVFGDPVWIISQGPQVLLDAQVTELDGGFLLNWDIREEAFHTGVVETMFEAYRRNIEHLLSDRCWDRPFPSPVPEQQLAEREVTPEPQQITDAGLHSRFFAQARRTPESPAVLWASEGARSYGELSIAARSVAAHLRSRGVSRGSVVGIRMEKGPDQVTAVLGVLAAGATWVPIGMNQPPARIQSILRTAGCSFVLQDHDTPIPDATPIDFTTATQETPLADIVVPRDPKAELAYILFTSGSTGTPKGVEVPHAAVLHTIEIVNSITGINGEDRTLGLSSLEFDLSIQDIFAPLSVGGAVVCLDARDRHDAEAWADRIREHGVTHLYCVPPLLDMLLSANIGTSIRDLRWCLLGGDWVTTDLPARLREAAPACRFAGLGGATETPIHNSIHEVRDPADVDPGWRGIPFGTPLPGMAARIVGEHGADQPDYVPGELWIAGPGLAAGYRGDPELTEAKFPIHSGTRWYRTGDRARYLTGGIIEFLGRVDDQIKIRGYRIETGEVAAALRSLPGVDAACVTPFHASGTQLGAVVESSTAGISVDSIRSALGNTLPEYMIPDRLVCVQAIPLTPNGKLDRRRCAELLSRAADTTTPKDVFPRKGSLEALIATAFATVLGHDPRHISLEDDFIALGGDSVLLTKMMSLLREELDYRELPVAPAFTHRTPASLATALRKVEPESGLLDRTANILFELENEL